MAIAFAVVAGRGDLSAERVRAWVDDAGVWAPLAFVVLSASLTVAFFPGPLLAGASGLLFGTAVGFPLSLTAAVLGASAAFLIARAAGGDALEHVGRAARTGRARRDRAARLPLDPLRADRPRACRTTSSTTAPA